MEARQSKASTILAHLKCKFQNGTSNRSVSGAQREWKHTTVVTLKRALMVLTLLWVRMREHRTLTTSKRNILHGQKKRYCILNIAMAEG